MLINIGEFTDMSNRFQKIVYAAVGTILSCSMMNINPAQTATISNYSLAEISPEKFFTAQTTKTPLKIEQTTLVNHVINPYSIAINETILATQLMGKIPENTNVEYKFIYTQSQTKFVIQNLESWQYNLQEETPKPLIEPGIVFGVGLISISSLFRKKRLR